MNIDKLNQWLSLVANFAVLFGLLALVVEIRSNTSAIRSSEWGAIMDQSALLNQADEPRNNAYMKALYSPDELSVEELRMAVNTITGRLGVLQRAYKGYQEGTVREEDWNYLVGQTPIYLGTGFGLVLWEQLKYDYESIPGFNEEIERALSSSSIVPDDAWFLELQEQFRK